MRLLVTFLVVASSLNLWGCANTLNEPLQSKSNIEVPSHKSGAELRYGSRLDMTQSWKLQYLSKCGPPPNDKCVGSYGYTIASDGAFQVGPGPEGQVLTGFLSNVELGVFRSKLEQLSMNETEQPNQKEHCVTHPNSELEDSIELSTSSGVIKIQNSKTEFCFDYGTEDQASELKGLARKLTLKYYPATFPSPCIDAAFKLEQYYNSQRSCEHDSDCSYIGEDFSPLVETDANHFLIDDCSYIKPIAVANIFNAVSNQLELLNQRAKAQDICGQELHRPFCANTLQVNVFKNLRRVVMESAKSTQASEAFHFDCN